MNLLAALLGLTYAVLLVFLVVLGLVHVVTRHCGRGLAVLVAGGLLIASMRGLGHAPEQRQVAQSDSHRSAPADVTLVSTEDTWEHLNRPRIALEREGRGFDHDDPFNNHRKNNKQNIVVNKVEVSQLEKTEPAKPTPQDRPSWVDNPPKRVGNVYRVVVAAGPYKTEAECYQNIERQLSQEVIRRIEQLVPGSQLVDRRPGIDHGQGADLRGIADLGQLGIAMEYVWRDICTEAWVDTSAASFGEMKHVHVLMQFGATQDKELTQAYRNYQRRGRIAGVGTTAGAVVAGLMLLYGLLQADTVTKGYYSKRLFFGVPAAIIGLILLFIA